ncbi:MAG: AMP-binding protein [Rhizobiaceae bacterium]
MTGVATPWEDSYPPGLSAGMEIETFPVNDLVSEAAAKWPDRPALDFRGRKITYAELAAAIDIAAGRFVSLGVLPGDRVALLLPNTPWHPVCFFGALKAGATVVHASPLDSPRVLAHKLSDSGAKLLLTTNLGPLAEKAAEFAASGMNAQLIVCEDAFWGASADTGTFPTNGGIAVWNDLEGDAMPALSQPVSGDTLALLQYTGGTTGLPKAAMLTHDNLSAAVSSYENWYEGWKLLTDEPDKILLYLPLFHIYGLSTVMLRSLRTGNELWLRTRFDPAEALDDIEAGVTVFPGVPTMWIAICAVPGFEKRDLSSLRIAASGGAPMPVEVAARFRAKTGLELVGGWGMSETAPAGTNLPFGRPDKAATIGIPLPGVFVRIVSLDDPKEEMPVGETGELAVRGKNVTTSYYNRPEENASAFVDGWFLTGDIGFMDEEGFFTIVDRKKDMIISGGFNVYPQMIEQAVYEHDDVEEVLVIGIPDDYRGEAAKAFIKLRDGASPMSLEKLRAYLKGRVGPHELPAALEIRADLPKTPVGKLSKIELKQEEAERRKTAQAS